MRFLVNIIVILAIVALALYCLYKSFKQARKGPCAACDLDCPAKKLATKLPKKSIYEKF